MQTGSLTIGDTNLNYGGGNLWNEENAAGLLIECLDNTEIAVQDNGSRIASFMFFEGRPINLLLGVIWDMVKLVNGNTTGSGTELTNLNFNVITYNQI